MREVEEGWPYLEKGWAHSIECVGRVRDGWDRLTLLIEKRKTIRRGPPKRRARQPETLYRVI